MASATSAAHKLEGQQLDGGWKVLKLISRPAGATGGNFSVGYLVEAADGRRGFLKAMDYSDAFVPSGTPVSVKLQRLTESINFEKYVLARCRDRKLDRVVVSIASGTIENGIDTVEYLIFELADRDARGHLAVIDELDIVWRLKSLHHIATGLEQLHRNEIIHQDLKPSNVLVFESSSSKLADLGRAACEGQSPPHSMFVFAGDRTYAPPDVLYRFPLPDVKLRSLSFDSYLLGSMATYFFTGEGMTALLLSEMDPAYADWENFAGDTDDVKLQLRGAFTQVLTKLGATMAAPSFTEVVSIVQQLCDPDPTLRGHPREKRGTLRQFSLERYIGRFDALLKRAEIGIF